MVSDTKANSAGLSCLFLFRRVFFVSLAVIASGVSVVTVTKDYLQGTGFTSEYSLVSGAETGDGGSMRRGILMPDLIVCTPR